MVCRRCESLPSDGYGVFVDYRIWERVGKLSEEKGKVKEEMASDYSGLKGLITMGCMIGGTEGGRERGRCDAMKTIHKS